jgi:hypothetical protein
VVLPFSWVRIPPLTPKYKKGIKFMKRYGIRLKKDFLTAGSRDDVAKAIRRLLEGLHREGLLTKNISEHGFFSEDDTVHIIFEFEK